MAAYDPSQCMVFELHLKFVEGILFHVWVTVEVRQDLVVYDNAKINEDMMLLHH